MQLQRNEIMTGLLVVGTVAITVGVLVLLGAPGLFHPLVTYKLYFDNASGIKQGAPVMLAGRKIGQVQKLYSPVSREENQRARESAETLHPDPNATPVESPDGKSKYEVRVDVQVDRDAIVYRDTHARLMQLGMLGDMAIDFTQGTETSGRAKDGDMFAGERTPDFSEAANKMLEIIKPVATEATATMKELENTAQNLSRLTEQDSELNQALVEFKNFGEHLVDLTAPDSALSNSLDNIEKISNGLAENNNIEVTLQNFRNTSEKLKSMIRDLGPAGQNIKEFTETIKSQPWRLIWPSTKKTPETTASPAADTITVRKSAKSKPTPKAR
jgi:phospholipid/cholesterol/gamma-HCH transport system substrate-binding protein